LCCDLAKAETSLAQSSDGLDIQDDRRPADTPPCGPRTVLTLKIPFPNNRVFKLHDDRQGLHKELAGGGRCVDRRIPTDELHAVFLEFFERIEQRAGRSRRNH
jgi:hypothetical protein